MFKWLKKCVEESQNFDAAMSETIMNEATQNTCKHESDASDCSLIRQLKEKQAIERTIKNDIKELEKDDIFTIECTCHLLHSLYHFLFNRIPCRENFDKICNDFAVVRMVEDSLCDFSIRDIDNIANELKILKQRDSILAEKRSALKAIQANINDIKSKLGIE